MADEETPAEDADTPVEEIPGEEADPEVDAAEAGVEAGAGDAAAPSDAQPDGGASGIKSRGVARAATVAAGSVVAGAAAIVGAVWAIAAIVDDDDDYRADCCVVDFATSIDPDGRWGSESDSGPRAYRGDRYERFERDRSEQREYRQERRDRREQAEREGKKRGDRYGETGREPGESSDSGLALETKECKTILSSGAGGDAVTILVCNAPGAEWPGFEPDSDGDYFEFRKRPRGFWFSPFFGPNGERPFRDGMPFGDGRPFEDGAPFRNGVPFDLEQFERMMEMLDGFDLGDFLGGLEEFLDELELEFPESQTTRPG